MIKGLIFNIQRFSLHDGPGIRTTVFFKGCPLNCIWCQNPEGIGKEPQVIRHSQKCIGCYGCLDQCPAGAVNLEAAVVGVDLTLCRNCLLCTDICPAGAVEKAGKTIAADDLMTELLKDRIVFEESKGGITFSGGEPFMQPAFLLEMLRLLQYEGVHTAIETCGHTPWSNLEQAVHVTDLFLYDLKLIDEEKYRQHTAVSGNLILTNLKKLAGLADNLKVRMPLIAGINDDAKSLKQTAAFLLTAGIEEIELIPYHSFGEPKYEKIGRDYKLKGVSKYSDADLLRVRAIFDRAGIKTNSKGDVNEHSRTGIH